MNIIIISYSTLQAKDYEVAVESLELEEIIGQGQFGDVYRGIFKSPVSMIKQWKFVNPNFSISLERLFFSYVKATLSDIRDAVESN